MTNVKRLLTKVIKATVDPVTYRGQIIFAGRSIFSYTNPDFTIAQMRSLLKAEVKFINCKTCGASVDNCGCDNPMPSA